MIQHLLAKDIGSGRKPPDISVDGNTVESVNSFVYLGSLQSSDGQCRPDLTHRIGLACAVMTSLKRICSDKCLTLDTKLCIPHSCFVCVTIRHRHLDLTISWCEDSGCFPPEASETRGIRWYDRVRNEEVLQRTGLTSLSHLLYVLGCHLSVNQISYSSNQGGSYEKHISLITIMFCFNEFAFTVQVKQK